MSDPWPERGGPVDHTARPGDHVSRIAATYGFRSYEPVWTHAGNAALRQRRRSPHVLAVGDVVHVPAKAVREVERGTEQRHRFTVRLRPLVVRVAFQRWGGTALDAAPREVRVDGAPVEPVAGKGTVEIPITPIADACVASWDDGREVAMRVGFLQPADVLAGYRERLNNLGYRAGDADDPADAQLRSAVEEFQCDEGLDVDGKCGPVT